MAAIEDLFGRLRAEAAIRGEDWLQRQVGALLSQDGGDMGRMASGPSRVQTGQAASGPEHTGTVSEGPAGGTRSSVGARGGRPGGSDAAALPARRVDQAVTGPVVGSRRVGSQATVASPPASSASHLQEVERVGSNRVTPSRKASAKSPHGSRARRGSESGPGPSASGTEPPGGSSSEEEDRSEGERSGSEDEVLPRTVPATRDSRRSADGIASTQPVGQVPGAGAGGRGTGGPLSGVAVADSIGTISTWIRKSLSEGTWAAYEKVWSEWSDLVRESEVHLSGPEVRTPVLYFLSRNMEAGVSSSALDKKLAGLAFLFKWQGWPDLTKDFWVRQALKGYRKQGRRPDARRPVSFEVLRGILAKVGAICSSRFEVTLFRAAFALAFFGAFRVGELVSPSKLVQGGMGVSDVGWTPEGVTLWLRRSKTDQSGKGRAVHVFPIEGSELCPVGLVRDYLDIRPGVGGAFLVHENGSPMSRYQFVAVFRKCLGALGLVAKEFSAHSFRIGAATEAARNGLELTERIRRLEGAHKHTLALKTLQDLIQARAELVEVIGKQIRRKFILAKKTFYKYENKASKLLARSLQSKKATTTVHYLTDEQGHKLLSSPDIAKHFVDYYTKRYNLLSPDSPTAQVARRGMMEEFLKEFGPTHLSEAAKTELDRPLNNQEVEVALKQMKSGKSPAPDGLMAGYYKTFAKTLTPLFLSAFNSFANRSVPP
ncbi:uncharacterized protein LOC120946105 [Rana temporaria]|uniref:uncharacterized protein LOC120946105 n=1 Tax=Rana temporaria TaxID=8407 RepID=UPI001AAE079A|nr:uncharacterized protein LOC120946105 [Rana temporaria]